MLHIIMNAFADSLHGLVRGSSERETRMLVNGNAEAQHSAERGMDKSGGLYPATSGLGTSDGSVAAVLFRRLME